MAYNENLSDNIREILMNVPNVTEKKMFGGICYMVDEKMCIGVVKDEIMCRINPEIEDELLEKVGCRPMDFNGKKMKGYVYINEEAFRTKSELEYWVNLCLEFNPLAKSSKKK